MTQLIIRTYSLVDLLEFFQNSSKWYRYQYQSGSENLVREWRNQDVPETNFQNMKQNILNDNKRLRSSNVYLIYNDRFDLFVIFQKLISSNIIVILLDLRLYRTKIFEYMQIKQEN